MLILMCSASQVNALAQIIIALTQTYGAWPQLIRSGSSKCGQSYLYPLVGLFKDIPIYIKAVFFRQQRVFLRIQVRMGSMFAKLRYYTLAKTCIVLENFKYNSAYVELEISRGIK